MLHFLVHKIFTFYINGVLNCKRLAPGPKGQINNVLMMALKRLSFRGVAHAY